MVDDLVAVDRRVEHRVAPQRLDRRVGDVREVGERDAAPRHRVPQPRAARRHARHVDLDDRRAVSRAAAARHHVAGDRLAHRRQRLAAAGQLLAAAPLRAASPLPAGSSSGSAGSSGRYGDSVCSGRSCSGRPRSASIRASTSRLRTRPPIPVPSIVVEVDAVLGGDPPRDGGVKAGAIGLVVGPSGPARSGSWSRLRPGSWCSSGCASPADAAPSISAIGVPTGTFSPASTRIRSSRPRGGRRYLHVDLVGGDLADRLVGLDPVAGPLAPLEDRPVGDGDAHLRHRHLDLRLSMR